MCDCNGIGVIMHAITPPVVCEIMNDVHEIIAQLPTLGVL